MTEKTKWSQKLVICKLKESAIGGVVHSRDASATHISLPSTARKLFGSFEEACKAAGLVSANAAKKKYATCAVKGCDTKTRSSGCPYCEKHYGRIRRNGHTGLCERKDSIHSGGYVLEYLPNHPLRTKFSPRVYKHRRVYYDNHGEGPFNCHWCDHQVTWSDLHIDHLNDVKTDNRIENLVASCPNCNQARGREALIQSCRANGINITFNGVTKHLVEWATDLGIDRRSLLWRLKHWPKAKALTHPRRAWGRAGQKSRE